MFGTAVGSVSSWISASGIIGILGLALLFVFQWRKANLDGRRVEIGADAGLRTDLLGRIKDLEIQAGHHQARLDTALADERRRCDAELATMRLDFQKQIDGLMRQFLAFQMAVAGSAPPLARSPEIDEALDQLRDLGAGK
jgi:hypothetical protein